MEHLTTSDSSSPTPAITENTFNDTDMLIPDMTLEYNMNTIRKVVESPSAMPSAVPDQVVPTTEVNHDDTVKAVVAGLYSMPRDRAHEATSLLQPIHQLSRPLIAALPPTHSFTAWNSAKGQEIESERNGSNKKQRLFGTCKEGERLGSVKNPILLPAVDYPSSPKFHSTTSVIPIRLRKTRKKKRAVAEYTYHGIQSLLDAEGRPKPFPVEAQASIRRQQKRNRARGFKISSHAYDESFAGSLFDGIEGGLFSSTGADVLFRSG
jgi:hypothetical protein